MLVVLASGANPRVLGVRARERNARVAARMGATVVDAEHVAQLANSDEPAVLVPAGVLIERELFDSIARPDVARAVDVARPFQGREKGREILTGPARDVARHIANDVAALVALPVSPDAVLDASTPAARRHAAWHILKRTAKSTDGWVSRNFNRPISRVFSFALLSLGLNASHASAMTLMVGLGAAYIGTLPGYLPLVIMGLLFHFASVLDGVDGEMARATLTESEAGAKLDAIVDQLTYVACFVGATIGWAREGNSTEVLVWTMAIAVALVLSLLRGARFVSRYAPNASFVFIDRSVRRAARDSRLPALQLAAAGFTLLRRDLFSIVFFLVSLTGQRVMIPALVVAGILLANTTFSLYHRELAQAALAENPQA